MAGRTPKPWFRKSRGEWYVQIKGVTHRLGKDKHEADRKFHLLMAGEDPEPMGNCTFASEVADQFQIILKNERSASTLDWYCHYLDPFKQRFLNTSVDDLTADTVRDWVNGRWKSQASRRAALRAIKAAFRRAVRDGRLTHSVLANIQLPGEVSREKFATKDEYEAVLAELKDERFADLIRFVWLTGARPQEAVLIDASHVDLKAGRIVLPKNLAKGKKRPRVIYLSDEARKVVKRNLSVGRLFKTLRGQPFHKDIIRQRFRTLEKKLGTRYCLYHFRHGFAHRSLAAKNDALTVATLMGHSSPQTLARVYAHLNQAEDHLREALKRTK